MEGKTELVLTAETAPTALPEFLKLPSFDNLDDTKEGVLALLEARGDWHVVITEKIHGASFVAVVCPGKIGYGKRSGYLAPTDEFFGVPRFDEENRAALFAARTAIVKMFKLGAGVPVYFYGELFGGQYKHPEVKKDGAAKRVQKDAQYSPRVGLAVFGIRCGGGWLCFEDLMAVCVEAKLMVVPHIQSGELKNVFGAGSLESLYIRETVLPEALGLPVIKGNMAEGVVLKLFPQKPKRGELATYGLTYKWKHPHHRERTAKAAGAAKAAGTAKAADKKSTSVDKDSALEYINKARVANYVSKMTEGEIKDFVAKKDMAKYIREISQDVFDEFWKERFTSPCSKDDQAAIFRILAARVRQEILAYIKELAEDTL